MSVVAAISVAVVSVVSVVFVVGTRGFEFPAVSSMRARDDVAVKCGLSSVVDKRDVDGNVDVVRLLAEVL